MWVRSVTGDIQDNGQITGITSISLTADKTKAKVFKNYDGAKSVFNKLSLGLNTSAQLEKISE